MSQETSPPLDDTAPAPAPKKRGRPKGSKNRASGESPVEKTEKPVKAEKPTVLPDDLAPWHEFIGELCGLLGESLTPKEIERMNRAGAPVAARYVGKSETVQNVMYGGSLGFPLLKRIARLIISAVMAPTGRKAPPAKVVDVEEVDAGPISAASVEAEKAPGANGKPPPPPPHVPAGDAATL